MSITVSLGTNNSDERYLTKNITWTQKNVQCDVYEPVDRLNPQIILDKDKVDLTNVNYMDIPEFGRKYFITNIVGEAGNKVSVYGHVDVLSTYDAQIRRCPLIAARSESHYNFYLQDERRLFNAYTWNQYITITDDQTDLDNSDGEFFEPDTIILIAMP